MSSNFAKFANISCVYDLFSRARDTKTQANKTFEQCVQNVQDAFEFNKKYVKAIANKKVLILDNVITTGSTILHVLKV